MLYISTGLRNNRSALPFIYIYKKQKKHISQVIEIKAHQGNVSLFTICLHQEMTIDKHNKAYSSVSSAAVLPDAIFHSKSVSPLVYLLVLFVVVCLFCFCVVS